jgi:hypothetical protein
MANWMFEPPVSTPTARMIAMAASRMRWYSLSVSVWAGATVIESPVCTPMASKFSIEQTMTTLSSRSRMTSSSYSFQPSTDWSMRHLTDHGGVEPAADDVLELLAVVGDAAAGAAERERGADDRRQADSSRNARASSMVLTCPLRGTSRPTPRRFA